MIISKIKLINFRNYSRMEVTLNKKMNIFVGDNGSGKTNILESITILALTKSHRVGTDPNLIHFGQEKAKILGKIKQKNLIRNLEVEMGVGYKKLQVNKSEIKRVSDYISNLNVIVFTPDDLEIIKGSPSIRRNLLNMELSQISKIYLNTYNEYNKILKTRNEYLKILFTNSIADKEYLNILTEKLIEKAIIIYRERKKYIDLINEFISDIYLDIAKEQPLEIKYETNILFNSYEENEIREKMTEIFKKNYKRELMNGMTMFGPHRDDFSFFLKGHDLKFFGSQGQQKLAVLSYKLSSIPIFMEFCKTEPVLLLDDIFSELDVKKRNRLLKYINKDIQCIITTTDLKNIQKKYLEDAYIYEVKAGRVERK